MKKKTLILCMATALSLPATGVLQAEEASSTATEESQQQDNTPAYLGVVVGPVPRAVQAQLPENIEQNQGLMIMRVIPDSPAAEAGLRSHDVLLSFDEQKLMTPKDLVSNVRNAKDGQKARMQILRHGKTMDIEVTFAVPKIHEAAPRHSRRMAPPLRQYPEPRGEVIIQKNFQAMAVNKLPNGNYKAMIEFLDQDGNLKKYEYEGSGEELREQIRKEKDLPAAQKQQLLNALGGRAHGFPMRSFPAFPKMEELEREFFNPPPWTQPYRPGFWD